ncbi:zinc ribbon domain-containing protein [Oscillochloris sp. ZM17-4]|uniref:FHA domain-containing protein n=1 Tax=Oscillochloris sp. ZM17-4 TaxID=2866714 RepID=UPI001C739D11|nr:FHA domain-containing protein [Oscillochloris sp. ZM17-4]MBX0326388.1 zinc ribbon domain-containing protein [Oscillochloris sp. ZM17-4]
MPFCPQCGVDNPAAASFCDQCGAQLIAVPAAPPAPTPAMAPPPAPAATGATIAAGPSVCPQCGTAVIPGEAFCDTCGASLLSGPPAPAAAAPSLPYAGVPPQPSYPPPQPVAPPPIVTPPVVTPPQPVAPPPIVTPPAVTPPAQGRPSLAGVRLAIQPAGANLPLPAAGQAVIGRADPVSNVFPDIDLTDHGALERGVGRRHARIFLQGGQVLVEDLDSTNGTFLNAARVAPRQPQSLRAGDEPLRQLRGHSGAGRPQSCPS